MTKPVRQPAGRWVNPLYERLLTRLRGAGRARVVHRPMAPMETRWTAPDRVELPPLVPPASADDGWEPSAERPRVAVYLNPHFRDPEVATAVESAVDAVDGTLYAIGEGFADRDRWRGCDPNFASRVADADLLVSAPGMGAVGMSRTYRTPFLMVRTDQPEQKRNAQRLLSGDGTPLCDVVDLEASELAPLLESRVRKLVDSPGTDSPSRLDDVHGAWRRAFLELLERVAPESRPEAAA